MYRSWLLTAAALFVAGPAQAQVSRPTSRPGAQDDAQGADGLPPAFEKLLPRGRIAAIRSPRYVPAGRAKIPDDAWVMGVLIEGQARAYSLNLLNRHEVVNDTIGATPFAVVW